LPSIPGFEDQSVTVLEVVDEQDDATTLSNIALYFSEMGDLDRARSAAEGLTRFSTNFGAWVARAEVAAAIQDDAELAKDLKVLQSRLALRIQPLISWDRRVDLAVVLARAKDTELAKKELALCINAIDDDRIRSLSPETVYRLLVLCRGLGVTMPPTEHALAISLVPPTLRVRLQ
jgi:tetratricopeptide (TPR) repeat protein